MNDVKAYLYRYLQMKRLIKMLELELDVLKASIGDIRATDYGKDVVDGTKQNDAIANLIIKIEQKESKIEDKKQQARALMLEIFDAISGIPDENADLRNLLMLRYIHDKKWEDIAAELHYSVRTTTNLHNKALNELKGVMNEQRNRRNN